MYKNIFFALITILTHLNFINCAMGENLSIPKTSDTVSKISSEEKYVLECIIQFQSIIQFVENKLLALDQKEINDLSCDDCTCDFLNYEFLEEHVSSENTKIIICKGHSKQIDIWKKLFSGDKKSNCSCKKAKKSNRWLDNMRWFYGIKDVVTRGIFFKYFYFYNNDQRKDGSDVKKCGCKILKNVTTECIEVCLCKVHLEVLKAWERQIFHSIMVKS